MYFSLFVNRFLVLHCLIWAKLGIFCNWFEGHFFTRVNLSSYCEVPLIVLAAFKSETDVAREYRPKADTDDIASTWWDYGGIEVKYYLCPVQNSWKGRKEGVKAQSQKNVLLVRGKKSMKETCGLCDYFQALVRSEAHFWLFELNQQLKQVEWVHVELALGGHAVSVLAALLLPSDSLLCHQMEWGWPSWLHLL